MAGGAGRVGGCDEGRGGKGAEGGGGEGGIWGEIDVSLQARRGEAGKALSH